MPTIPKKLHAVWYGGPPPADVLARLTAWRTLHPGFELKVWDETNSPLHVPYLHNALRLRNYANASNFTRLWALWREGGIYLDTDVDLVQTLDPLIGLPCFLGFESRPGASDLCVNNAVLGAAPRHPFIAACVRFLLSNYDGSEPANLSSPVLTTQILREHGLITYGEQRLEPIGVQLLPRECFYPYGFDEPEPAPGSPAHPRTLAIHRWHKTWHPPRPSELRRWLTRGVTAAIFYGRRLIGSHPTARAVWQDAQRVATLKELHTTRTVRSGLFRGTPIANVHSTGSSTLPKLIGSYEHAVQEVLAGWLVRDYAHIYNVGCDSGHLLVGLGALFPGSQLHGYDINLAACAIAEENVAAAGLKERTEVHRRAFRWPDLDRGAGRTLMVCDIEGGEASLFSESGTAAPDDLIVELHDFVVPGIQENLEERLAATHTVRIITEASPPWSLLTQLSGVALADMDHLANEHRPIRMRWLVAERLEDRP